MPYPFRHSLLPPDSPTPSGDIPNSSLYPNSDAEESSSSSSGRAKHSRPRLFKRFSGQHLLGRQKHKPSANNNNHAESIMKTTSSILVDDNQATPPIPKDTTSTDTTNEEAKHSRRHVQLFATKPVAPTLRRSSSTPSIYSGLSEEQIKNQNLPVLTPSSSDDPGQNKGLAATTGLEEPVAAPAGSIAAASDYPLASAKRNHDFHQLFRSVPESDSLIDDYKCALQKDILVQGHIYISEHNLCFNANILGWVTNLVIAFADITCIEKRMTAMIIPNGIQISTLHAKHVFASFLSRDLALEQMEALWHIHNPNAHRTKGSLAASSAEPDKDVCGTTDCSSVFDESGTTSESGTESDAEKKHAVAPEARSARGEAFASVHDHDLSPPVLEHTYTGTVEIMDGLLFETSLIPRFMKKYGNHQEVSMGRWKDNVRDSSYRRQLAGAYVQIHQREERVSKQSPDHSIVATKMYAPPCTMHSGLAFKRLTSITKMSSTQVKIRVTAHADLGSHSTLEDISRYNTYEIEKEYHSRLHRVLMSKRIRERVARKMRGRPGSVTSLTGTVVMPHTYLDQARSVARFFEALDYHQIMALCILLAVLTNLLMAFRLTQISAQLTGATLSVGTKSPYYSASSVDGATLTAEKVRQMGKSVDHTQREMLLLKQNVAKQTTQLASLWTL